MRRFEAGEDRSLDERSDIRDASIPHVAALMQTTDAAVSGRAISDSVIRRMRLREKQVGYATLTHPTKRA